MIKKTDTSSLKVMGDFEIKKRENDGVQNRTFKTMGCKIAQLTKDRGKSAIKP